MRAQTLRDWIPYSIILTVLLLSTLPLLAHAAGSAADAMCDPVKPECPCNKVKDPKSGKCVQGKNNYKCPPGSCRDTTNGNVTLGHCEVPMKCKCDTTDGKPCEQDKGGKPPEMPKIPESPPGKGGGASASVATSTPVSAADFTSTSTFDGNVNVQGGAEPASSSAPQDSSQTLPAYFSGAEDASGTQVIFDNLSTSEILGSILGQLGLNPNLGDFRELTPPPDASGRDSIFGQATDSVDKNFVPESPATGFMPPHVTQASAPFYKGILRALWAWLGL